MVCLRESTVYFFLDYCLCCYSRSSSVSQMSGGTQISMSDDYTRKLLASFTDLWPVILKLPTCDSGQNTSISPMELIFITLDNVCK